MNGISCELEGLGLVVYGKEFQEYLRGQQNAAMERYYLFPGFVGIEQLPLCWFWCVQLHDCCATQLIPQRPVTQEQ